METRAILRYSGIPANKMRQVAQLVRGKDVDVALHSLQFVLRAAALPMRKLIQSAAANAREKANADERRLDTDRLYVKSVAVDEGPTVKRWRPRAQGRAFRIRKRTCHVTLILDEYEEFVAPAEKAPKSAPKAKAETPAKSERKSKSKSKSSKSAKASKAAAAAS